MFCGSPGTTVTGWKLSTIIASSVGVPLLKSYRSYALRSTFKANPCGVCTAIMRHVSPFARRSRGRVSRTMFPESTHFTVSGRRRAGSAAPVARAACSTREISCAETAARAASCTSTWSSSGGTASSPKRTDSQRSLPPCTTEAILGNSTSSCCKRGKSVSCPTSTMWSISGCEWKVRSVHSRTGMPPMGCHSLPVVPPNRSPLPAARIRAHVPPTPATSFSLRCCPCLSAAAQACCGQT
ncbi:hypothetical protein HRbin16_02849 [bacterium HR16]|nr:hypothetical protein HRbin16_02849 [bacterium HR16]